MAAGRTQRVRDILVLISTLTRDEMLALKEVMQRQWGDGEGGTGVREPRRTLPPHDQAGAAAPVVEQEAAEDRREP